MKPHFKQDLMPLLTICIPTYKRFSLLKMLLDGLLPQAQALGVKIQVNDNCSRDGTVEYLSILSRKYSCLFFVENLETVPIDENMFLSMQSTQSHYIYPLGDDDFLPEGSLAAIVSELTTCQPDILVLSGLLTDYKLNPHKKLLPVELLGRVFRDPRPAFQSLWDKMPFGSFVMRQSFVKEDSFRKYFGTCHAYTGIVWDNLDEIFTSCNEINVHCMVSPTVLLRGGEKSWKDYKTRIYLHDIPRWFQLLPRSYSEEVTPILQEYLSKYGSNLSLLAFRRSGQLTSVNCGLYLSYFRRDVQQRAEIVSRIPPLLARVLRFFLKIYNKF